MHWHTTCRSTSCDKFRGAAIASVYTMLREGDWTTGARMHFLNCAISTASKHFQWMQYDPCWRDVGVGCWFAPWGKVPVALLRFEVNGGVNVDCVSKLWWQLKSETEALEGERRAGGGGVGGGGKILHLRCHHLQQAQITHLSVTQFYGSSHRRKKYGRTVLHKQRHFTWTCERNWSSTRNHKLGFNQWGKDLSLSQFLSTKTSPLSHWWCYMITHVSVSRKNKRLEMFCNDPADERPWLFCCCWVFFGGKGMIRSFTLCHFSLAYLTWWTTGNHYFLWSDERVNSHWDRKGWVN